ncbi:S8 family peptidase [Methylococcus geothermalis]|uniref:S8 family serine peptidase n=1 Tax=Methylococcus geothermalis TaxID=2681310 RepID=A0A858Q3V3_9GAMM|nr:S8 family peptidase [Methylococcus geothermalis]QJD28510.1 S8 family serine peptidase [Methylococcus geothermalis]
MNAVLSKLLGGITVAFFSVGSHSAEAPAWRPTTLAAAISLKNYARPEAADFVDGEILVRLKEGQTLDDGFLWKWGLYRTDRVTSGGDVIYRRTDFVPKGMPLKQVVEHRQRLLKVIQRLQAHPAVEYAQPNWILHPVQMPDDPDYKSQWHYFDNGADAGEASGGINLPKAWASNVGHPSVVVAVIDTGLVAIHEDISRVNVADGYDFISDPARAADGDGRDPDETDPGDGEAEDQHSWHGTHVAGTVGVVDSNNGLGVAGVNWHTKVQSVRVLGKGGGTTSDIVDAIRWAAGLPVPGVPDNPTPAQVVNMSLGGLRPCLLDPAEQSAINDAVAQGVTVVVSAGNEALNAAFFTPASCKNVITVAASDFRGHLVSRYSNYGRTIEIMAPGGDLERDDNGDGNPDGVLSTTGRGYEYYNGTSMAAPHVAGVVGLLQSARIQAGLSLLTPQQVLQKIQENAISRTTEQCPRPCGAGLLNAAIE